MEIIRKRRPIDIARGFFLLGHPLPVLLHIIAVSMFALLAAWPRFVWGTLFLVVAAHTAMQLSIAVLNDYCDRTRDTLSKKQKPIPLGLVTPREALVYGFSLMIVMLLLLIFLNPLALLISLLYLAFGQSYNLGLKSTPLSGVVFALAIPLIPVYAFVGVGRIVPFVFWLVPVVALLGIALNLANSLPDIEEDATSGARTLAVVLGVRRSFLLVALLIFVCIISIAALTLISIVPARPIIIVPMLTTAVVLLAVLLTLSGPHKPSYTRKNYFYLVALTCLLLVSGWIIGAIV
jgi:4-hydroxybenzoate polyprenyltransferase